MDLASDIMSQNTNIYKIYKDGILLQISCHRTLIYIKYTRMDLASDIMSQNTNIYKIYKDGSCFRYHVTEH